jgi:selenocysteine lyase/cysteine desulfurase
MPDGRLEIDRVVQAMDERTRIVAASLVQFSSGYRLDVAALAEECHSRNAFLAIDGMQAAGAVAISPDRDGIDFFACSGAKWLMSPQGTGFLYCSATGLAEIEPSHIGWLGAVGSRNFNDLLNYSRPLYDDARRLEVGSLPFQAYYGMRTSLELLLEIGLEQIETRRQLLTDPLIDYLSDRGFHILGSIDRPRRSGIVAFAHPDAPATVEGLARRGIYVSAREGAIRVAPHFYNTPEEIDHLIATLDRGRWKL